MSITVREYQTGDNGALAPIYESFERDHDARNLERGAEPLYPAFVAIHDGKVVGVLEGKLDSEYSDRWAPASLLFPQAWIDLMIVSPSCTRQGIGAALVRFFIHKAVEQGLTFLALQVDDSGEDGEHQRRVKFFRRLGLRDLDETMPFSIMGAHISELALVDI